MLSLKLVINRGAYSWAVCVDGQPLISYGSYKRAVIEMLAFEKDGT